jgi:Probable zinc-ribbon domain
LKEKSEGTMMKSNKQRRAEIMARREVNRSKKQNAPVAVFRPWGGVAVCMENLVRNNSYGFELHDFVARGFYVPKAFRCKDCNVEQVWTERAQKFWYETCKSDIFTTAIRCRSCRAQERARQEQARAESLPGLLEKRAKLMKSAPQV